MRILRNCKVIYNYQETNCFIQRKGSQYKDAKKSDCCAFVDDFEEAKQWLIGQSEKRIKSAEDDIEYNQKVINIERENIEKFKLMEEK